MKIADSWAKGFFPGAAADGLGGGLGPAAGGLGGGLGIGMGGLSLFGYDSRHISRLFNDFLMEPDMKKFPKDFKFGYDGPTTLKLSTSSGTSSSKSKKPKVRPISDPEGLIPEHQANPENLMPEREIHIHNEIGGKEVNKQIVKVSQGVVKTYSDRGLKRHNLIA